MKLRKKEMTPRKIPSLPPLILDGRPKSLRTLTTKELLCCVDKMLGACLGQEHTQGSNGKPGHFKYSDHSKPLWWPKDVAWSNDFPEKLDAQKKESVLKSLLKRGYNFYQQEETLNLFESQPEKEPKWLVCEENDGESVIYSKASGKVLHRFRGRLEMNGAAEPKVSSNVIPPTQVMMEALDPMEISSCSSALEMSLLSITTPKPGVSPRRCPSIMGALPKSPIPGSADDDIPAPVLRPSILNLKCSSCSEKFGDLRALTSHSICCKVSSKRELKKREHLLGLGLVPHTVEDAVAREIKAVPPASELRYDYGLHRRILARFPFSSETGAMLQDQSTEETESPKKVLAYESGCSKASWDTGADSIKQNLRPPSFTTIYKPFRDYDELDFNLNKADWKLSQKRRRAFQRLVTPCTVLLPRLTEQDLLTWSPDHRKRRQKDQIKIFRAPRPGQIHHHQTQPAKSDLQAFFNDIPELNRTNFSHSQSSWDHTKLVAELEKLENETWKTRQRKNSYPRRNGVISPVSEDRAIRRKRNTRCKKRSARTLYLCRGSGSTPTEGENGSGIVFVSTIMKCGMCGKEEIYQYDGWIKAEYHAKTAHGSKFVLTTSTTHDNGVPMNLIEITENQR